MAAILTFAPARALPDALEPGERLRVGRVLGEEVAVDPRRRGRVAELLASARERLEEARLLGPPREPLLREPRRFFPRLRRERLFDQPAAGFGRVRVELERAAKRGLGADDVALRAASLAEELVREARARPARDRFLERLAGLGGLVELEQDLAPHLARLERALVELREAAVDARRALEVAEDDVEELGRAPVRRRIPGEPRA